MVNKRGLLIVGFAMGMQIAAVAIVLDVIATTTNPSTLPGDVFLPAIVSGLGFLALLFMPIGEVSR